MLLQLSKIIIYNEEHLKGCGIENEYKQEVKSQGKLEIKTR